MNIEVSRYLFCRCKVSNRDFSNFNFVETALINFTNLDRVLFSGSGMQFSKNR